MLKKPIRRRRVLSELKDHYSKETALYLGGTGYTFVISATIATGIAINGGCNELA